MLFRLAPDLLKRYDAERVSEIVTALDELNDAPAARLKGPWMLSEHCLLICELGRNGVTVALVPRKDQAERLTEIRFLWVALKRCFKDYRGVIERIVAADSGRFDALDYGKKIVHDEGGETLIELLEELVELALPTARHLFTLLFLLRTDLPGQVVRYHRRHL